MYCYLSNTKESKDEKLIAKSLLVCMDVNMFIAKQEQGIRNKLNISSALEAIFVFGSSELPHLVLWESGGGLYGVGRVI